MKAKLTVADLMGKDGGIYFGKTLVMPGQYKVHTIQVHRRLHFEEMVAIVIFRMFAFGFFDGGAEDAKIEFVDAGCQHEDALALLKKGIVQIGVGNGPFNEHETNERLSVDGECGATLVAKLLRVDEDPCVSPLLKFALRSDLQKLGRFDLPEIIKVLYSYNTEQEVFDWGTKAITALIMSQMDFFGAAKGELENAIKAGRAGEMQVSVYGGRTVKLIWINSEEKGVAAYARSKLGGDAGIVVQESLQGKFYIPVNKRAKIRLDQSILMLRVAEAHKAGLKALPVPLEELNQSVVRDSVWHLDDEKTGSIFGGGSLSNIQIPTSKLTIQEVVSALRRGLIRRPQRDIPVLYPSRPRPRYEQQLPDSVLVELNAVADAAVQGK